MIEVPWAFAIGAGMVAALNPCGFAMLPAYLTYFVGTGDQSDTGSPAVRAVAVAMALTAGFVTVFGLFGLVVTRFALSIERQLPWVTVVIGIGLVGLGIALLRGRQITLSVPKWKSSKAGGRELPSMYLFGVSYAVASLSCTVGPFLAVTTSTFRTANYVSGVLTFVAYGLGMGLLVGGLTMAVALARSSVVTHLRRLMPHVTRISGVLLVGAGAYVAWYGWWEVRVLRGDEVGDDPLVEAGERVRERANEWIADVGEVRLAIILASLMAVAVAVGRWRRRNQAARHPEPVT